MKWREKEKLTFFLCCYVIVGVDTCCCCCSWIIITVNSMKRWPCCWCSTNILTMSGILYFVNKYKIFKHHSLRFGAVAVVVRIVIWIHMDRIWMKREFSIQMPFQTNREKKPSIKAHLIQSVCYFILFFFCIEIFYGDNKMQNEKLNWNSNKIRRKEKMKQISLHPEYFFFCFFSFSSILVLPFDKRI